MKIQQLRHFLLVVEEGGFRAAAEHAHRTQATFTPDVHRIHTDADTEKHTDTSAHTDKGTAQT